MKKVFLSALAGAFLLAGCAQLEQASATVEEYTGLSKNDQVCVLKQAAENAGHDVSAYEAQLAAFGIVCEE